jgi:hypothetical protein
MRPWEVHWLIRANAPEHVPGTEENWKDRALKNLKAKRAEQAREAELEKA